MKNLTITFVLIISSLLPSKAQELVQNLNFDDVKKAFKLANIELFKFDFDYVDTTKNLIIHVDELYKDSIANHKQFNFGTWNSSETKQFTVLSKINSDKDSIYFITLSHLRMELSTRFNISPEYRKAHYWMNIEQEKIAYDQKVPLLFYGQAWEDEFNGQKILKFCWGDEVTRKMDNPSIKNIDHMILISYELTN